MKYGFLCCGPSGVGKSSNIHKMLENANLNKDDFLLIDPDKLEGTHIEQSSKALELVYDSIKNNKSFVYIATCGGTKIIMDILLKLKKKKFRSIVAITYTSLPIALKRISQRSEQLVPEEVVEEPTTSAAQPTTALPKGVVVVTMPRLSDTMTDGTVATWLKKVGDKVTEGDILAEIETDKATMEFESFNAGTLLFIGIPEGGTAPCDSLLAIIGPAGTDIAGIAENFKASGSVAPVEAVKEAVSEPTSTSEQAPASSSNERVFVSPLARKIAEEKGINLSQVNGSGENGRIIKSDVENFVPGTSAAVTQPSVAVPTEAAPVAPRPVVPVGEKMTEEIKNSQMRKIIAKRLSESLFTAPHYNLVIEVSMDEAMKSRAIINSVPDTKVSFNDMVIKASAFALKKHPKINSQWREDSILINYHVNIGVAVAVEDGLVVPVLPFTDAMSLSQIGENVRDLAGRAKGKKLLPSEMEGSTFTISNLGMFGITEFNSIINQPNSAILSVGAIVEKPVVKNGQIVVGNTMMLSLACDHRTIDGATGAQFLQTLKQYIENPVTMLA